MSRFLVWQEVSRTGEKGKAVGMNAFRDICIMQEDSAQDNTQECSEAVKRLLEVMEYDIPYTSKAFMEKLGLKSREGFRRNYLHPAVEVNLIRMTIPDKPNSRNQRYVKI